MTNSLLPINDTDEVTLRFIDYNLINLLAKGCAMQQSFLYQLCALILSVAIAPAIYAKTWVVDENLTIEFSPDNEKKVFCITFTLKNDGDGYVGLAFSNKLYPADTLVMGIDPDSNKAVAVDAFNYGVKVLPQFPSASSDNNPLRKELFPSHGKQNYTNITGQTEKGITTLSCCRAYDTGDPFDYTITVGQPFTVHFFYNLDEAWYMENNYKQAPAISSNASGPFVTEVTF